MYGRAIFFLVSCILAFSKADTPANCSYSDVLGDWQVYIGAYNKGCTNLKYRKAFTFKFDYPNQVVDLVGNIGTWTLIYNQGFEFTIANRKWFGLFDWDADTLISKCDVVKPGVSYDTLMRQPFCARLEKINPVSHTFKTKNNLNNLDLTRKYVKNEDFISRINSIQSSWTAVHYPEFENMTLLEMQRFRGGRKSIVLNRPKPAPTTREQLLAARQLPKEFDWRNPIGGLPSIVTPVRHQGNKCGSCYAFASTAALESRVRLITGGFHNPFLSPQDVVDCNPFSQGCDGGFAYLTAGKYAEYRGFVDESCNPYHGNETGYCKTKIGCQRYYTTKYQYIGGYYGACNELLMKLELVHKGPFPIGFQVYDDFVTYKGGVYQHTKQKDLLNGFNPFETMNHAVLLVGYGFDKIQQKPYWIVKNSWGTNWGEKGFFRILRGSDECGIESAGLSFEVIV